MTPSLLPLAQRWASLSALRSASLFALRSACALRRASSFSALFCAKSSVLRVVLCAATLLQSLSLLSTTRNVAPLARITASSQLDDAHSPRHVADGVSRIAHQGEWRSGVRMQFWGEIDFPWLQLDWDEPQELCAVTLYDIASDDATCSGGELVFDDGERILVRGIPANGAPKTVTFAPKATHSLRFEVTDGDGHNIGLSELEAYATPTDYVTAVDPYIETTRGRYFFFVTGSQPFGMISAAPLTRNKNQGGGGYNYNATEVLGFPQIHAWMLAGLDMMPVTGAAIDEVLAQHDAFSTQTEQRWKSPFSHDGEQVQPAYHRLFLERYGLWVEQTCTDRASLYRLTYTDSCQAAVLLNLGGYVSTATMVDAHWQQTDSTTVEGSFVTTGRLWGGPDRVRVSFVAQFDRPFLRLDTFGAYSAEATPRNDGMSYADAPAYGTMARYQMRAGDQLHVKMAVSYTSIDNARENLTEIPAFDFDQTRLASQQVWNDLLGRIDVRGGTPADRTKFYTDLWHSLLGRHKLDDLSGDYPDYTQGGTVEGKYVKDARLTVRHLKRGPAHAYRPSQDFHIYNSDALWLSQWNLNTLWGLAYPEVLDDFAASFLQYSLNGGLLARGPCAGGYSFIMTGCPATSLITSAYQQGIHRKYDPRTALREMVRNHEPGGMQAMNEDADAMPFYEAHGYVPNQAGLTIQWAFEDWALAEMAQKMGRHRVADRFHRRARGWEASFHPGLKLILPRTREGGWLHEDPMNGWGYVEANAWQATFGLSHDLPRLAELMGGPDSLCLMLDHAFRQSAKDDFMSDYGNGYVSYANQPGLSNAHVFAHAGRPDLTQYWVGRVRRQTYGGTTPDKGYGGHDEDQGQMASLSALMSMGLFAIDGCSSSQPRYDLTTPLFSDITIRLHPDYCEGHEFRIRTHNLGGQNLYIRRAALNEQPLTSLQLSRDDYQRGGLLELWLGGEPQ